MEYSELEIDDSLYSRQRYMLGDQAMKKMASSTVLLIGCDGLGVEIAKNLALTGVGNLLIADSLVVTQSDLKSNFYTFQSDVGNKLTRAQACVPRIAELNPYVNVRISCVDALIKSALQGEAGAAKSLKEEIEKVDCVITSQRNLKSQKYLNELCRESFRRTRFVGSNVCGVFSSIFCDFGENFEVVDATGETAKEAFVASISRGNPGIVTCSENKIHGFEDGDLVSFREIQGMEELNGQVQEVKVLSPYAFAIGNTTNISPYVRGGIVKQVQKKATISHEPLGMQLLKPDLVTADLGKSENPMVAHSAFIALSMFEEENGSLPRLWSEHDAEKVVSKYMEVAQTLKYDVPTDAAAKKLVSSLCFTCRGVLPPLASAVGGMAAQEVLKSLTGKYTPLKQWLYLDFAELLDSLIDKPGGDGGLKLYGIEQFLGRKATEHLASLKIFMVGCGAIGCEMLKNFALLGVSCLKSGGKLSVTDNDVIEKSNLNRQFLFRSKHVGHPKSSVASSAAREINPHMNIQAMQHKVGPDTEQAVFNDQFFQSHDIVINALDNIQARRYMDSRCITNHRPLLESGTMGPKGHVQVIVPFITESYASQQDPTEVQYPFCTLKSFPSQIEHTIQWARDKFEVLFSQKPMTFNKFWEAWGKSMSGSGLNFLESFSKFLATGGSLQDAVVAVKLLVEGPSSWKDCIYIARCRFEKFFNHKAKNLLQAFPLDTRLDDGSPFWSLPKRPPTPIVFDSKDPLHMQFIVSVASIFAAIYHIKIPAGNSEDISLTLERVKVPEFVPSNKVILTDENVSAPKTSTEKEVDVESLCGKLDEVSESDAQLKFQIFPEDFEKDDDCNHHIDFISSAANLRARMYGIETVDRLEVKRIAGRIIPAISTTTAAVAGFATIQFLQVVLQSMKNEIEGNTWCDTKSEDIDDELAKFRNCFLNLALPLVIFSEPASAQRTVIRQGLSFTGWDRWEVRGNEDFKLKDFIQHFQSKLSLSVSAVLHGSKMVFIPIMPGHKKRLDHLMTKLIKAGDGSNYVDLTITFESASGDQDDISCPPIRYYF